jgi:uncharacterized protein (TIGR02594 family)
MTISTAMPPWVERAIEEIGVEEVPGPADNPRIVEYHSKTSLKATDDEIAWCSAFCCWSCDGLVDHPRSARARHWLRVGTPQQYPAAGCIAVLARGRGDQPGPWMTDAKGHVGFFMGFDNVGNVKLLSGNQGNAVNITTYPVARVLGYRWLA